jgi:hypothetical protein
LKELCLESVARDFANDQTCLRSGVLPEPLRARIVDLLDVRLDLEIAGERVRDESYWRRRASSRWPSLVKPGYFPLAHGRSWKQMFFEKNLEEEIRAVGEKAAADASEKRKLDALAEFGARWTRNLCLTNLRTGGGAVRFGPTLFEPLAGCLTSLTLEFGAGNVGVAYEPEMFGMSLEDCDALAKCLPAAETLVRLALPNNALDCRKVRRLCIGLVENVSLTILDLSGNDIACRGTRAIAKLLDDKSVLRELDLSDNDVGEEGASRLARAIAKNHSLSALRLRANAFIGDSGGEALCDAVREGSVAGTTRLESIDLSACGLGPRSARAAARMLRCEGSVLKTATFAGNDDFGPDAGGAFRAAFRPSAEADGKDGVSPLRTANDYDYDSRAAATNANANRHRHRHRDRSPPPKPKAPLPSVVLLEVRGCAFGAACEEALANATRANRERVESAEPRFPDRDSGAVTNLEFFENLRETAFA